MRFLRVSCYATLGIAGALPVSVTKTYKAAIEKNNLAIRAFDKITDAYRAREIGDAEFLAGRKIYKEEMAEFDAAYAAETSA